MKQISRKLLITAVLTVLLSVCAWAEEKPEPKVVTQPDFQIEVFHVNPEYEALGVTFAKPGADCMTTAETTVDSLAAAAVYLREQMENRVNEVTLVVRNYTYVTDEKLEEEWKQILNEAILHTGVPTQGDYIVRHYGMSTGKIGRSGVFLYTITYDTTLEQENAVSEKIDELFSEWDRKYDFYGLSDYDQVKIIYDYICDHVTYDYKNLNDKTYTLKFSAYAALINGTAVCQGYANLFYRMVLEAGIDNRIMVGYSGGVYHSWNIAELGDAYYYVDATWDAGKRQYSYFLQGKTAFCKNHTPDSTDDWDCKEADYPISAEKYEFIPVLTVSNRADTGKISLSWTPLMDADYYELYRSSAVDGEYLCIYSGPNAELTDRSSAIGKTYYYKVCVWVGNECSEFSEVVSGTGKPGQTVVTCTVNEDTGNPVLTWTEVYGAEKYEVWRAAGADGKYTRIWTGTGRKLTNSSVEEGKTYYYKVRAVAGSVKSAYSTVVSVIVPAQLNVPEVSVVLNSDKKPVISWNSVDGAEKYEVWRAVGSGEYKLLKTMTGRKLTNTSVEKDKTYFYKVRAVVGDFCGEFSSVVSIRVPDQFGAPALTVSNNADTGKVVLTWNEVDSAEKYEVWYSTSKSGTYKKLWTGSGTKVTHNSADVGVTYYYKVRALADGVYSEFSAIKSRTCDLVRPTVTLSNNTETGKIVISWTAVSGASKYEVYRATSENGTYTLLKTMTGTRLTNTSAEPGVAYYYKVKALHGTTSSANSAYSAVKSRICDLAQPVITLSNDAGSGKIVISWNEVVGASRYEVYRATNKNDAYTRITTITGTKFTNTSTEPGVTYYYKVRAICDATSSANSAYSAIKFRTCDLPQPVITLVNNEDTGKVVIGWEKVEGAAKYEVYRSTSKNGTYTKLWTGSVTMLTHSSAEVGVTYYYKVRALHGATSNADSAYSVIKSRTCDCARPTLTIKLNSKGQPALSWDAVEGAVKYEVYRSTSENGTYSLLWSGTGTKLTNSSAKAGVTYYYKVKAICSATSGNSAYSAVKSVTTP